MIEVGLKNFKQEIVDHQGVVLVDFWASYCGPCRALKPVLEQVANEGVKVVTLNIEDEPELTKHFDIQSIPTIIRFNNGVNTSRVVGTKSKFDLLKFAKAG